MAKRRIISSRRFSHGCKISPPSASGAVVIYTITTVNMTIATDKPSYSRRQYVTITTTVNVNGSPASSTSVNLRIGKPNNAVNNATVVTAAHGVATYSFRINNREPLGTWQVQATSSVGSVGGNATRSFIEQ